MEKILIAIEESKVPVAVRQMLVEGLKHSKFNGELHSVQSDFADLLKTTLEAEVEVAKKEITDAVAERERLDAELQQLDSDKAAADVTSKEAAEAYESKVAEKKAMDKKVTEANKEHDAFKAKGQKDLKKWNAVREDLKRTQEILAAMTTYEEGTAMETEGAIEIADIAKFVTEHGDATLASALTKAFNVKAEERQPFDKMSVDASKQFVQKRIEELEAQIEANKNEENEFDAELLGLWAIGRVSSDRAEESGNEVVQTESEKVLAAQSLEKAVGDEKKAKKTRSAAAFAEVTAIEREKTLHEALEALQTLLAAPATPVAPAVDTEMTEQVEEKAEETTEKVEAETVDAEMKTEEPKVEETVEEKDVKEVAKEQSIETPSEAPVAIAGA